MKILFLAAWYPNRLDEMEGLFVRKHAQAAALYDQVCILFVKAETRRKDWTHQQQRSGNVVEHYIYYPKAAHALKRFRNFIAAYKMGIRRVFQEFGKPDLIHCNIMTRHALMAWLLHAKYKIPYVITEHWSRYYRHDFHNLLHRKLTCWLAKKAQRIMPVSESLASAMQECGIKGRYTVVRNVVDDFFFEEPSPTQEPSLLGKSATAGKAGSLSDSSSVQDSPWPAAKAGIKTMVHICCFDEPAKNNTGLLRALKTLSLARNDFRMIFAGYGRDWDETKAYAEMLHFKTGQILFPGEISPQEVKQLLDQSCFLVLFSNYETASVVISEALACGKPVVASRTGGIPEIVNEANGILVKAGDEHAVWKAMNAMLDHYTDYPAEHIRQSAEIFRFSYIGNQFHQIYLSAGQQASAGINSHSPAAD